MSIFLGNKALGIVASVIGLGLGLVIVGVGFSDIVGSEKVLIYLWLFTEAKVFMVVNKEII
ncbi:MAG: hypothetical protein PHY08_10000, partial [Candidatus Cloacimonetes bacterium]|nr:hypothetical protein [Candidatus Cloacimonadota bacterium]